MTTSQLIKEKEIVRKTLHHFANYGITPPLFIHKKYELIEDELEGRF